MNKKVNDKVSVARNDLRKLAAAAICLALCLVLPFFTAQNQQLGNAMCLMHIPVLLCGFICGWQYGALIGFVAPLLRYLVFGMPPLMPVGAAMAFELAVYGLVTGLLYKLLPKKLPYIYVSLVSAMLLGRIVWGLVKYRIAGFQDGSFGFDAFVSGAFTVAVPGIIIQILLVPVIVLALKKAKLMGED